MTPKSPQNTDWTHAIENLLFAQPLPQPVLHGLMEMAQVYAVTCPEGMPNSSFLAILTR